MLLAIDTSTQWMGLGLYDGEQILGESIWHTRNHHTVELAPAIQHLMDQTQTTVTELKAVAVALGPGSFTSLRIGLAVGKGMALASHLPLIGIPTLDILAAGQPVVDIPLAAVLQAGRGRLAVGWYQPGNEGWKADGPAIIMTGEELEQKIHHPSLVCGELNSETRQALGRKWKTVTLASPARCLRRPSYLAELAWNRFQAGDVDDTVTLAPIYLHVAEAIPE